MTAGTRRRLRRWQRAGLALSLGTLGCVTRAAPERLPISSPTPLAPATPRLVPAPHHGSIWAVQLDHNGEAAVTVDGHGQVRFWPRLDEHAIPLEVPVRGVEEVDMLRTTGGWRILTVGDGKVTTFWASPEDPMPRRVASVPGRDGVLMAGGPFVAVHGQRLVTYDRQGRTLGADDVKDSIAVLLTPADRSAAVVISGVWHDSMDLGWEQGTSYAGFLGRFDGSATRYVRSEGGMFESSGTMEIHALEEPSASTFTVAPGGVALGFLASTPPDEEDAFRLERVDFERGSSSRLEEGEEPGWWTCSDAGHNDWASSECPDDPRPKAASESRAKWAKDIVVIPWRRWLLVVDGETRRALGARELVPQSGTWSPDGRRLAFAINEGDDQFPEGRIFVTEGPLDGEVTPSLRAANLDSKMGIAELVWGKPDTLLVVGLEAQLSAFDMADRTPSAIQILGEPMVAEDVPRVEHNRAAGLTLIHYEIDYDDRDYPPTLVSWSKDGDLVAGPVTFADGVTVHGVGLLDGEARGLWVLGPQGLATTSLAEVRNGPVTPRFTPLSADPRAVFDVSWDPKGARVVDWGDRWEVSVEGRTSEWLRDVLAFGPLLRAADGSKLLTLPDCDDRVAAVHPAPAPALGPGESWALPVADHTKIRWSPDGSRLLVVGDLYGELPVARVIDAQNQDVVAQFQNLPYEIVPLADRRSPPEPRPITGRCRSSYDLHQELFPGDA